jgi:hypothetical protein
MEQLIQNFVAVGMGAADGEVRKSDHGEVHKQIACDTSFA